MKSKYKVIDAVDLLKSAVEEFHCIPLIGTTDINGVMNDSLTFKYFLEQQPNADISVKFEESDFTDEELKLLKAIFKGADAVVQSTKANNYDTFMSNTLYSLKQKLGIDDVVN